MDRWALVTGATSGMGWEYTCQLAAKGCNVLMVSNQAEALASQPAEVSGRYGVQVVGRYADLAEPSSARELYDWCASQGWEIDLLVCNAGMFFFGELSPALHGKAEAMLQLHVMTTSRLCMLFAEDMKRRRRGHIIVVSSLTASIVAPGITVYSATKAYLKTFSKSLYYELRPYGVGVTTVVPGAIATPLYGMKPSFERVALAVGLIRKPRWLVRRALRGMRCGRSVVRPGALNYLLPLLVGLLPKALETRIWMSLGSLAKQPQHSVEDGER